MVEPSIPVGDLRPLADRLPREQEGELVFEAPTREVAVGGDTDFVRDVLSLCDGRRTVAEIATQLSEEVAEVSALVESLIEQGIVTDCTQAWRRFHRESSATSGMFRELGEQETVALGRQRFEPSHTDDVHLLRPVGGPLSELAERRRSALPGGAAHPVSYGELSSVLALMYRDPERTRRPVPSGGAFYPLCLHVLVREPLEPLQPGLWWYHPERNGLMLVGEGVLDAGGLFVAHPTTDALIAARQPIVFVSADLERMSRKYANRAYRLALMEAGAAMQNAYLIGAELDLPVRAVAGVIEARLDSFLELPTGIHSVLAVLLGS